MASPLSGRLSGRLSGTTIVFDLDGTLVDTAPDLTAAANHVFGLIGLAAIAPAELRPLIGRGSRAMIEEGLRLHGITTSAAEVSALHELFLPYYADHLAVLSRPFEGVSALLESLAQAGVLLAVCTNKLEALSRSLLRQLGFDHRFAAIAGRDTFDVFKPAPGHLTGTIAMAGGRPDRAVMVGDSEVDIATAAAAGVPSIGVTFGYTSVPVRELKPTVVIDHYREFMGALEQVF
ncbi:MAG: phosphoglycolate phosphatase [Hyphomicrobiaceae bacterium]|nr:phosphoglycolate phosphatase [Hyphomicrobiaceae bacterium]